MVCTQNWVWSSQATCIQNRVFYICTKPLCTITVGELGRVQRSALKSTVKSQQRLDIRCKYLGVEKSHFTFVSQADRMAFSDLPMREKLQLPSDLVLLEPTAYDVISFLCVYKENR